MSIWGSIIGGGAGYALGGPLGALLGLAAGHAVGRALRKSPADAQAEKNLAFTIAAVALAAKMAKADGAVCAREKAAFARLFHFDPAERANVERVFDLASRSTVGFESYARQVAGLFDKGAPALEELLDWRERPGSPLQSLGRLLLRPVLGLAAALRDRSPTK